MMGVQENSSFPGHDHVERYLEQAMIPFQYFFVHCFFGRKREDCSEIFEFVAMPEAVCYKIKDLDRFTVTEPGSDFGFYFVIDLHQEWATVDISHGAGVFVVAYDRGLKPPSYKYDSINIRPGQLNSIAIEKHVRNLLPTPYNPIDCINDRNYSEGKCLNDCLHRKYWKGHGNCSGQTIEENRCSVCDIINRRGSRYLYEKCNCTVACNKVDYKMTFM